MTSATGKTVHIAHAQNVGRCDHVWATHLSEHYDQHADAVFFLKDIDLLFDSFDADGSGDLEYNEINKLLRRGGGIELDAKLKAGGAGEIELTSKNKSTKDGTNKSKSAGGKRKRTM